MKNWEMVFAALGIKSDSIRACRGLYLDPYAEWVEPPRRVTGAVIEIDGVYVSLSMSAPIIRQRFNRGDQLLSDQWYGPLPEYAPAPVQPPAPVTPSAEMKRDALELYEAASRDYGNTNHITRNRRLTAILCGASPAEIEAAHK